MNSPSDAKLASLSFFRKWPVFMATIVNIERRIQTCRVATLS